MRDCPSLVIDERQKRYQLANIGSSRLRVDTQWFRVRHGVVLVDPGFEGTSESGYFSIYQADILRVFFFQCVDQQKCAVKDRRFQMLNHRSQCSDVEVPMSWDVKRQSDPVSHLVVQAQARADDVEFGGAHRTHERRIFLSVGCSPTSFGQPQPQRSASSRRGSYCCCPVRHRAEAGNGWPCRISQRGDNYSQDCCRFKPRRFQHASALIGSRAASYPNGGELSA